MISKTQSNAKHFSELFASKEAYLDRRLKEDETLFYMRLA